MEEIKRAIEGVEKSLKVNETRVTENMKGLLSRLESVQAKLASAEL